MKDKKKYSYVYSYKLVKGYTCNEAANTLKSTSMTENQLKTISEAMKELYNSVESKTTTTKNGHTITIIKEKS